jgi:tetratricopeptide (TPR) repeat protein
MLAQSSLGEGEKTTNLRFLSAELSHYARGMAALESGDVKTAQEASERMDAGLWRGQQDQSAKDAEKKKADDKKDDAKKDAASKDKPVTEPILPDADAGPLMKTLNVASLELRAGVLVGEKKIDEAKKVYADALAEEKKLGYHEPPFYIRPVGENEAEALLRAKDYAGAKAGYESALVERPNSGFELYGLARVKELQGDVAGARESYNAFLKAWSAADASRPEVAHARSVVSAEAHGTR